MAASFRALCGIDLSPGTEGVFSNALALSQGQGGALTLLNVTSAERPSEAQVREKAIALAAMQQTAAAAGIHFEVTQRQGARAATILKFAHERPFDLVVLGAHQPSRSKTFWNASVSARVIRRSNVPVLVVPIRPGAQRTATEFTTILCPTNLSPTTGVELEQAVRVAVWSKGRVALLHVFQGAPPEDVRRHPWYFSEWEHRRLLLRAEWLRVVEERRSTSASVGSLPIQVVPGRPSDEILRIASDLGADIIYHAQNPARSDAETRFRVNHRARRTTCPLPSAGTTSARMRTALGITLADTTRGTSDR